MDRLTPEQRHKNMQNIRSKNTKIERKLCEELYSRGIRYRKNVKDIPGKPDIAIKKYKMAIFCDSEFFHGYDWPNLKKQIERGKNPEFWIKKITRNMERDAEVNAELKAKAWTVIRFWGNEIKKDVTHCADIIENEIKQEQLKRNV